MWEHHCLVKGVRMVDRGSEKLSTERVKFHDCRGVVEMVRCQGICASKGPDDSAPGTAVTSTLPRKDRDATSWGFKYLPGTATKTTKGQPCDLHPHPRPGVTNT